MALAGPPRNHENGAAARAIFTPASILLPLELDIHPSDPWPLPGHPEAMKMSCRRDYFHTSDPWPLPGHPETTKMEPPPGLFSHQCAEVEFCEVRGYNLPSDRGMRTP